MDRHWSFDGLDSRIQLSEIRNAQRFSLLR